MRMDEDSTNSKPKVTVDTKHNVMSAADEMNLHVIGLGYGGCMALKYIHDKGYKAKYTTINEERLKDAVDTVIDFISFVPPKYLLHTRPNGEAVYHSQMELPLIVPDEVINLFEKGHFYVLLAALGGYTGTFMFEGLSKMLIDRQEKFLGICSIPFAFEGHLREEYAKAAVNEFNSFYNIKSFERDMLLEKYPPDLTVRQALEKESEEFCNIFEHTLFERYSSG